MRMVSSPVTRVSASAASHYASHTRRRRLVRAPLVNLATALAVALACLGCGDDATPPRKVERAALPPQAALWSEVLHSHTSGIVPRRTQLRLRFVGDVVPASDIGREANERLRFEPPIEGSATWKSRSELVFVPRDLLPSGTAYRAELDARGLETVPGTLAKYRFDLAVLPQDFDVRIDEIAPGAAGNTQKVTGTLTTADEADAAAVELILRAEHGGKPVPITWRHASDGRAHAFSLEDVSAGPEVTQAVLHFDGQPLGTPRTGAREIEIPAAGTFRVVRVQAVQDESEIRAQAPRGQQVVVVRLSAPADRRQDLSGLVRLDGREPRSVRVDGARLIVTPRDPVRGEVSVVVEPGIRGAGGERLAARATQSVRFANATPGVRFVGSGVILPGTGELTVPFEAINVRAVQVTAFEIYEANLGQLIQANGLDGESELGRVGRYLWRRTLDLPAPAQDAWGRYSIDLGDLFAKRPGSLMRLTLSIHRGHSTFPCSPEEAALPVPPQRPLSDDEAFTAVSSSGWDYISEYFESSWQAWEQRENPCRDSYYVYSSLAHSSRSFLASNLGLLAKAGDDGQVHVTATDLRTAAPVANVALELLSYQHQSVGTARTNADGQATIQVSGRPFYMLARSGAERGVLKLSPGLALPTSHFDVGGEKIERGVTGTLYGERGVWRPGDDIHLTLAVDDRTGKLPDDHPASVELLSPRGQLVQTALHTTPVGGFYAFTLATDEDAPTGQWTARAKLGGLTFDSPLRIETVVPNRLKVDLDMGKAPLRGAVPLRGTLESAWLHGASASGLRADVTLSLRPQASRFGLYEDFAFDDPARELFPEPTTLFDGPLDANGRASFEQPAPAATSAPGVLTASLSTRVFEGGGGLSVERRERSFYPFDRYVGVKLPKGDSERGMLLTDRLHTVQIASVSVAERAGEPGDGEAGHAKATPASVPRIEVMVYKLSWKWWWDKSRESLTQYASASYAEAIERETLSTTDGQGTFEFEIRAPAWGRYLLRACDLDGGHCTGQVFYIDWPGWAGDAQEDRGAGASVLSLESDKEAYTAGETARIKLPAFTDGRALLSIETGSRVHSQRWITPADAEKPVPVQLTADMAPNVYAHVTLLQPHAGKDNDRPLRLYGVLPITVNDPKARLTPIVETAEEWRPETPHTVTVRETAGRPMTYTLAVVDEGLLGLTGFRTPNLYDRFYRKEALGVRTWDLFDEVTGGYAAALTQRLALGGDGYALSPRPPSKPRRFPPVVEFRGPFALGPGEVGTHEITLPPYIGSVRAMVVAGGGRAYGSAEQSIPVRSPLMVLPTVPRTVRPGDELSIPIAVFTSADGPKRVTVAIEADPAYFVAGKAPVTLELPEPGDQIALVPLRVTDRLGFGELRFGARGPGHAADAKVQLEVRAPNPKATRVERYAIGPGESLDVPVTPYGLTGTRSASLEASSLGPIDLGGRLDYLIGYPHGCLEQVTSRAFPQLYLPDLVTLAPPELEKVQGYVRAAIERLRAFQLGDGGFAYWPGTRQAHEWASVYAAHFMIEASQRGYAVRPDVLADTLYGLESGARSFATGTEATSLTQAYRLMVLAIAQRPDVGAMNRLRESNALPTEARWLLASAYRYAGLADAARATVDAAGGVVLDTVLERIRRASSDEARHETFGSEVRSRAFALEALAAIDQRAQADALAKALAAELASDVPYTTHTAAWALASLGRFYGASAPGATEAFAIEIGRDDTEARERISSARPLLRVPLEIPDGGTTLRLRNPSDRPLSVQIVASGIPAAGEERAASDGLALDVVYTDAAGATIDPATLSQAQDAAVSLTVRNTSRRRRPQLALTYATPSGWQIDPAVTVDPATPTTAGNGILEPAEPDAAIEYIDVRDDAVRTYFGLAAGASATFRIRINASFPGRYYLPGARVEDMYDPKVQASVTGRRVDVVAADAAPASTDAPADVTPVTEAAAPAETAPRAAAPASAGGGAAGGA
jgi:hypothetical protein